MKRILSLLMAAVLVLSMVPVMGFAAEPVTVYMDPKNGSNETGDGTEAAPVQNFSTAYQYLQEAGGTIVMLSTVYYAGAVTLPACDYPVTIRAKNSADGIRTGSNFTVSGETTLEHMTFTHLKASTGTVISGNGYKLTMGDELHIAQGTVLCAEGLTHSTVRCVHYRPLCPLCRPLCPLCPLWHPTTTVSPGRPSS